MCQPHFCGTGLLQTKTCKTLNIDDSLILEFCLLYVSKSEISWTRSDQTSRPVHCTVTDGFQKFKKRKVLFIILSSQIGWFLKPLCSWHQSFWGKNSLMWLIAFLQLKEWDKKWWWDGRWGDTRRKIIAHFTDIPEKINVTHLQRLCYIFYTKDGNRVCSHIYFWSSHTRNVWSILLRFMETVRNIITLKSVKDVLGIVTL